MSGSAKPPRSGNPSCSMTRTAPAPKATGSWQGRSSAMTRKVLGRGLEALISGATASVATDGLPPNPQAGVTELAVDSIAANPFQPRTRFDEATLKELADSIRASGVIQPLLVRRTAPGEYQLVAGERRLRASQLAGLTKVPAIVKEFDDRAMLELALIE